MLAQVITLKQRRDVMVHRFFVEAVVGARRLILPPLLHGLVRGDLRVADGLLRLAELPLDFSCDSGELAESGEACPSS